MTSSPYSFRASILCFFHVLFEDKQIFKLGGVDTLGFCTILRPFCGPFLMSKLHYMSSICIFYLFWYFGMLCEKCAYLSLKRELKHEVGNLESFRWHPATAGA